MDKEKKRELENLCKFYHVAYNDSHPATKTLMLDEPQLASVLFNLLNVPEDALGLIYMKPVMSHLLRYYNAQCEVGLSYEFLSLYAKLWHQIYQYPSSNEIIYEALTKQKSRGFRGSNPLYAFLFFACAYGEAGQLAIHRTMLPSFVSFAPYLFRIMNSYMQYYPLPIMEKLCLAARKLIYSQPNLKIEGYREPNQHEKKLLANQAFPDDDNFQDSKFEKTNQTYILDLLFRDLRRFVSSGKGGTNQVLSRRSGWLEYDTSCLFTSQVQFDDAAFYQGGFLPNGPRKSKLQDAYNFDLYGVTQKEALAQGESSVDYLEQEVLSLPADFFIDPWRAMRLEAQKVEAMTFATKCLPWDKKVLSKSRITKLIQVIRDYPNHPVTGIMALALLMGVSEKTIRSIFACEIHAEHEDGLGEDDLKSKLKGMNFDVVQGCIWFYAKKNNRDTDYFYQIEDIVTFPLPKILIDVLPKPSSETKLFSGASMIKAKKFLKDLGEDGIDYITIGRLVNTFRAYAVHSYGLPELYVDILSGSSKRHLASQHFYITQHSNYLNKEWQKFTDNFVMDRSAGNTVIYRPPRYPVSEKETYIGASNTPKRSKLQKHFTWLSRQFPHQIEELLDGSTSMWNAYIAYLYGMFAVCTGQRPIRDPLPSICEVSKTFQVLHITDKNSRYHKEERCVFMCATLMESLNMHAKVVQQWTYKRALLGASLPSTPTFFPVVVEDSEAPVSANPRVLNNIFNHVDYIPELRNGSRHYILTALYHAGIQQSDIDWLSGHRKCGMEPEFYTSCANWFDIARTVNKAIETHIVEDLELEVPLSQTST